MTQEERELLLKDLCARLPYNIILSIDNGKYREDKKLWAGLFDSDDLWNAKPYLRPMSSMTEDERNEYFDFRNQELQRVALAEVGRESAIAGIFDWLNKKMFDYRGLIPKGLALEATEGMYNI
jgi:hypothetical protein